MEKKYMIIKVGFTYEDWLWNKFQADIAKGRFDSEEDAIEYVRKNLARFDSEFMIVPVFSQP